MSKRFVNAAIVYAALAIALTAGFGFGVLPIAAGMMGARLGNWYGAVVQAHGHADHGLETLLGAMR